VATSRKQRSDAQRNVGSLLEAAQAVFATSGVDAPAKEIADLAGVGVGTLYRHFPRRSDLVVAVLQREIDACADAGPALSAAHAPGDAVALWVLRYTELLANKPALAKSLHSGDPAFEALAGYFWERLGPVLDALLQAARGEIRSDISAEDLLTAVAYLCQADNSERMVAVLIDGLRVRR
jgi:AcrR family transcriptional regulator